MQWSENLISWYLKNGRDLPWRHTRNPYEIWLSEIILQQTRVAQGLPYYYRFLAQFPDVFALANAPEDKVLKAWQGLGYYSRARNLHKAAKLVATEWKGLFPSNFADLQKLPGVGQYTAAAIASMAFGENIPALDGNLFRVFTRYWAIESDIALPATRRQLFERLQTEIPAKAAGLFNQAAMDLGATICLPRQPLCSECPIQQGCAAYLQGNAEEFPVKKRKTEIRTIYHYYLLAETNETYFLTQRTSGGIWAGLYTPPMIENPRKLAFSNLIPELIQNYDSKNFEIKGEWHTTHLLTHRKIEAYFFHIYSQKFVFKQQNDIFEIRKEDLLQYPIPKLIENGLKNFKLGYVNQQSYPDGQRGSGPRSEIPGW